MKKNSKILALLLLVLVGFASCSKEEDLGESNIVISAKERTGLDKWIYDSYVVPFNIEVKYLWDDSELESDRKLVPPSLSKVQPFLEVVKKVWIDPYSDLNVVLDETFLKKLSPKQIILVGSLNYNSDGTVTLGTAEGGRKIVLYEVNNFDKTNKPQVTRMLHTLQHEFAHILHQTKMYPLEFKKITPSNYTATWANYTNAASQELGYITSYARLNPDEDFAEMVSAMLTMNKANFDAIINKITSDAAKKALRQKEKIVVDYYKEKYGIDIYKLQQRIVDATAAL